MNCNSYIIKKSLAPSFSSLTGKNQPFTDKIFVCQQAVVFCIIFQCQKSDIEVIWKILYFYTFLSHFAKTMKAIN